MLSDGQNIACENHLYTFLYQGIVCLDAFSSIIIQGYTIYDVGGGDATATTASTAIIQTY